jgi:hypothetical protein
VLSTGTAPTADCLLTNPGPGTPVIHDIPGAAISFESPVHDYDAVEFTANKRLANYWALTSSYRLRFGARTSARPACPASFQGSGSPPHARSESA